MENIHSTSDAAQFWNETEWEELDTSLNESFNSMDSAGSVQTEEAFACSYVLYDQKLAKQEKNIYAGVKYIGQTTTPNNRISQHKHKKRMPDGVLFIIVAEYECTDSIKLSLRDEYSLYRRRHLFKNLEEDAEPGMPDKNGTNAQARKDSLKGEQIKRVFDNLKAAIRTGNTWDGRNCKSTFGLKGKLDIHVQSHHVKHKSHKCQLCQKSFFYADDLTRHIKEQHDKKQELTCPHCDETFAHDRTLQAHLRTKHGPKSTECKCTKCGMTSEHPKSVKRHMIEQCGFSEEEANAVTGITRRRKSGSAEDINEAGGSAVDINEADVPKKKKKAIL